MVNAQGWLNNNYPKKQRKELKQLNLSWQGLNLEDHLDLSDFINLEWLDCSGNKLTSLDISQNVSLREFWSSWNFLTKIEFPKDSQNLVLIDIKNNNFPPQNLSIFSSFINLKELYIGDQESKDIGNQIMYQKERYKKNIYSRFYGSLEPLKNLSKLELIEISNTDIEEGLEFLSDSVKRIVCFTKENPNVNKVKKIADKLGYYIIDESYQKNNFHDWYHSYNYQAWKKDLIIKILQEENRKIQSLEDEVQRLANLIRDKKDRVIQAYLYSFTEKEQELLHKLITVHLEYNKTKKQKLPSVKLKKEKEKIYNELEGRIGEEQMEKVEKVLNDCEDLIHWDIELDEKIIKRNEVIEESSKAIQHIVNNFNIDISGIIQVENGQLVIGNSFGDQTNLSYLNKFLTIEDKQVIKKEITEETKKEFLLEYKIEQPSK